jgi:hypothetical protein
LTVGESAFDGCSQLQTVSLPTARTLQSRCFAGIAVVSLSLLQVTTITGNNHFTGCASLTSILLPSLLTVDSSSTLAANAPLIARVTLPNAPPSVSSTFNFASQPAAALSSSNVCLAYDLADGSARDGRFHSLVLDYSVIYILADGVQCDGRTIAHALLKSNIAAAGVHDLEVVQGSLFEDNFPVQLPQLRSLVIAADVAFSGIPASAFAGLENLETVDLRGTRSFTLGGRAFEGCLSLRSAVLTGLTGLTGDFHFSGCVSLSSISMTSLATVPKTSSGIFQSCTSLVSVSFGLAPPVAFHQNVFPIPSQVSLILPSSDSYSIYDNSVSVTGDQAGDSFWCGIYLPLNYFVVLINEQKFEGSSLYDAVQTSAINPTDILSIEVTEGVLRLSDISNIGQLYSSLNLFSTGPKVSVIGNLGTAFKQSSVRSVSMATLGSISAEAFKGCPYLDDISFPLATSVGDSAFSGCRSLTSISLPKVTTLSGDGHFKDCEKLATLNLRSLTTVPPSSSNIFNGILCKLDVSLPATPPQTFHRLSFAGINTFLTLPSSNNYQTYDSSLLVDGDAAGDFLWCGIPLVQLYIEVIVNQVNAKAATLELAAASIGVAPADVTSIQVVGGSLRTSDLTAISTRFPALHSFAVSQGVPIENNKIPAEAFLNAASLATVDFGVTVAIEAKAFEGCTALSQATFVNVPSVGARAFFGTALTSLSLPECRHLLGDSIFQGCASLTSIRLQSLLDLSPTAANLFAGCTALASIWLPASPPQIFHPNSFNDCPAISLELASPAFYLIYDNSVLVSGDAADDSQWCGIAIPEDRFPQLVAFRINNGATRRARTLSDGLLDESNPIVSLAIESGVVSASDFLNAKVMMTSLESLEIRAGTIAALEATFLSGHPILQTLIVHGTPEIRSGALQNMAALRVLDMRDVVTFPGSTLTGCTSLETADLRSVAAIQAGTFADLELLSDVSIPGARSMHARAFANCRSLRALHVPNLMELFGDEHFSGCEQLESVFLRHLVFVDPDAANIFAGCSSLSALSLWATPPDRFHADIFLNRQSALSMSIDLPDFASWRNYIPQSVDIAGRWYWYGIPHPSEDTPPGPTAVPQKTLPPGVLPEPSRTKTAERTPAASKSAMATVSPSETETVEDERESESESQSEAAEDFPFRTASPVPRPTQTFDKLPERTPSPVPEFMDAFALLIAAMVGFGLFIITAAMACYCWCRMKDVHLRTAKVGNDGDFDKHELQSIPP